MVDYYPNVEDRIVGHELHGNCFHKYELKNVYLSTILKTNFEDYLSSGYFDVGIKNGLIDVLEKELSLLQDNLKETNSIISNAKENGGYVSGGWRKKRLKLELKEQVYRNSLDALKNQ